MKSRFPIHPLFVALALALVATPGVLRSQTVSLDVGQVRSASLSTGDTLGYTFQAGPDMLLYGEVNQISVDGVVSLVNAEGQQLGRWDGPGRGAEAFSTTIRAAGEYTIRVAPFEDEEGDFEIRILQLEARSDDPETLADQLMFAYSRPDGPGGAVRVWRDGRTPGNLENLWHIEQGFRRVAPAGQCRCENQRLVGRTGLDRIRDRTIAVQVGAGTLRRIVGIAGRLICERENLARLHIEQNQRT